MKNKRKKFLSQKSKGLFLLTYALFSLLTFLCQLPAAYCQLSKTDSLSLRLKKTIHDTDRVKTLNKLGWELMYSNPDTAIILSNQALVLANSLPNGEGRGGAANSLSNLGAYNHLKADYPKALDYYLKALKIDEELY